MKLFKFLFLGFVLVAFAWNVNAQRCGGYTTTLHIQDVDGKNVEGILIQILPLGEDETRGKQFIQSQQDPKDFTLLFSEGHILRGKYKILVFSPENETFEMTTQFPHCDDQKFDVVLGSSGKGSVSLKGRVTDPNGAYIPYVSVSFENEEGKTFSASTDEAGEYKILLNAGKYKVKAESGFGFCKMENKEKNLNLTKSIKSFDLTMIYPKDNEKDCVSH